MAGLGSLKRLVRPLFIKLVVYLGWCWLLLVNKLLTGLGEGPTSSPLAIRTLLRLLAWLSLRERLFAAAAGTHLPFLLCL